MKWWHFLLLCLLYSILPENISAQKSRDSKERLRQRKPQTKGENKVKTSKGRPARPIDFQFQTGVEANRSDSSFHYAIYSSRYRTEKYKPQWHELLFSNLLLQNTRNNANILVSPGISCGQRDSGTAMPKDTRYPITTKIPIQSRSGKYGDVNNLTAPHSGEWIRLRGNNKVLTSGLVEVYRAGKWGYVCDDSWDIEDGSVACRQMGFTLGARSVLYTGEVLHKPHWGNAEILMDEIDCTGREDALHLCNYNINHDCTLSEAASVMCFQNRGCPDGWISGFGKCYKFFTGVKNFQNALNYCNEINASLVNINSMNENHFLSSILKNSKADIHHWYIGGKKVKQEWKWFQYVPIKKKKKNGNQKMSRIIRSRVQDTFWFPGWPSANNSFLEPKINLNYSCVTLSDEFESPFNKKEIVDYFFWKADVCQKQNNINFICQTELETKAQSEDCYTNNGSDYRGYATRTDKGTQCLSWADSNKVNDKTHPGNGLGDHTYCRNPDNDARPWCWTDHEHLKFGFCKIEECSEVVESTYVSISSAAVMEEKMNCPPEQFFCSKDNICIPKSFHCDKDLDCDSGEDEENCEYSLNKFDAFSGSTLQLKNASTFFIFESYMNVSEEKCAKECLKSTEFICRSFVYSTISHRCSLSQYNTQNGSISHSYIYDYYELVSQKNCSGKFKCKNGFCIDPTLRCNGNDDCKDLSDELGCSEDEKIEVSLIGGDENSGTVEISYMGEKGVICDDDWSIEDANVICRMLGYRKAEKNTSLNYFNYAPDKALFLLDDVKCFGNETSIKDCPKIYWKQHDCKSYEIAGVSCQTSKICPLDHFKCKNEDCLKAEYVCDNVNHCEDNSDEANCYNNIFKLVNGSSIWNGRVEVIRNGLPGTVCDDQWDEKEVTAFCRSLGFNYGGVVASKGTFGKGTGPIWLDNIECTGTEFSLNECKHDKWGVSDCDHSEDVGVICFKGPISSTLRPTISPTVRMTTPKKDSPVTVSLGGGSGPHEGVVIITLNQRNYYICDDNWDDKDATVVCRMLNYSQGQATIKSKFGDLIQTKYLLDEVDCSGAETDIIDCNSVIGTNTHNCKGGEQAGVICKNEELTSPRPLTPSKDIKCGYRPFDYKDLLVERDRRSTDGEYEDLNAPRTLDKRNFEKIIGGNFAQHGMYPWQVRVDKVLSSRYATHHCGAVLLSEFWLLSAAHCFEGERKSSYQMVVGDHHLKNKDKGEQVFEVDQLILHELYSKGNSDYDIALIKIKPVNNYGIQFNDYVQPACLPDENADYQSSLVCSISGWGRSQQAKIYPDVLKGVNVPIINQTVCKELYRQSPYTERMMCAGYKSGGIDTCDGDSGGPLVCSYKGAYTVLGVTSWGRGCAQPNAPGVYSNVKVYLNWIKSNIKTYSSTDAEWHIPGKL